MKLRMLIVPCAVAAMLSGCVTYQRTGLLFTPFGVAGVHSFAPPDSSRTPDDMKRLERIANQKAAEQAANAPEG